MKWILPIMLGLALPLSAQTVYLTSEEALKLIFYNSVEVFAEKKSLGADEKRAFEKKLGYHLTRDHWNFYVARTGKKVDGYALIDHEVGKTEPITFLTAITPEGEVKAVEVLVFREPIGSEIKDKRFLKQFGGKKGSDPIRIGQDIRNITGATLSSRAVAKGVRRALVLWEVFYGKR